MTTKPQKIREEVCVPESIELNNIFYKSAKEGIGLHNAKLRNQWGSDEFFGLVMSIVLTLTMAVVGAFSFIEGMFWPGLGVSVFSLIFGIIGGLGFWFLYDKLKLDKYYQSLARLPEEDVSINDPYHKMAYRLVKEAQNIEKLIKAWNAYVHRCYDLDLIPRDSEKEALYDVLVAARDQIEHEAECLCEIVKMQKESEEDGDPIDLVRMRQNLVRISTTLKALQKTRSEMQELEEDSGSILEATAKLDAIQPEISQELPESQRLRLKGLAAKQRQPS